MSRNSKIVLVILGSLTLICLLSCAGIALLFPRFIQNTVSESPDKAKQVASQIADYTLPPGYSEQVGMDFLLYKIVVIGKPRGTGLTFMLMQTGNVGASREEMEQQMRQAFSGQYQRSMGTLQYVGERQVTVKGKSETMTIAESTADSRTAMRQATLGFAGKGGFVLAQVMGSVQDWDDKLIDSFFASIR